jgi:hypothetical protein
MESLLSAESVTQSALKLRPERILRLGFGGMRELKVDLDFENSLNPRLVSNHKEDQ